MERDHDPREETRRERGAESSKDLLEIFTRDLDLPRELNREKVEEFALRGSETRILASVAVFRAVPREDLELAIGSRASLSKDVEHLRDLGLVESQRYVSGRDRCQLVTLTDRGRSFLETRHLDDGGLGQQDRYGARAKSRELAHDSQLFRAYLEAAERIVDDGGRITRVRLDNDLKRDYQAFLQEPNRRRRNSSGQPRRDYEAISRWANEHELPIVDDSVRFPDLRIEYERPDGDRRFEDVEVITPHYRGAHLSAKEAAGFSCYRHGSARIGGARTTNRGGRGRNSRLAEEMLK